MKKTGIFLIFSLFITFNSNAQLNFIDSAKNELGININPFLSTFGITTNDDFMTLQYKLHFSNISLRIGASGIGNSTYDDANLRNYNFRITDSVTLIDHYYDSKNTVRVNIGLEQQQMLKNKWKFYYGMDLMGGFSNEESRMERTTYKLKSDSSFKQLTSTTDSTLFSSEHVLVGVAFIGGFDYFFSKRISAGILGYFPISYEFQTGNSQNKTASLSFDQKFSILIKMHF